MKGVIAFLALCALGVSASVVPSAHHNSVVADKELILKHKNLLQLLLHIHQPNLNAEQKSIGDQWDIESNLDKYTNKDAIKKFITLYKWTGGYPEQGFQVSLLRDFDLNMATALFDILYYAKDYDTFYQTACWARDRINADLFVYALHVAIYHRDDTQHITLPPMFEVLPHLFVNSRVIQRATEEHTRHLGVAGKDAKPIFIPYNYTRNYYFAKADPETRMAVFTEDIGLNAYYTYFHLLYPFWMTEVYGKNVDRYGELFYYVHKQILSRYNLQRIAFGLPEIDLLSLKDPIKLGYNPELHYYSGMEVPARPDNFVIAEDYKYDRIEVKDIERRLRDVIASGFILLKDGSKVSIYEKDGFERFGKLIAGVWNSDNFQYYGQLYNKLRRLLSNAHDPQMKHGLAHGATGNYFTTLRDPAFYQICARVDYLFNEFKAKIGKPYTTEELIFPGVKIENVDVDKLITYYDEFDVDLTNAVDVNSVHEHSKVIARTQRLNNKPFNYNIKISSDKATNAMVRIFLGSRYDAVDNEVYYSKMRHSMVEMDRFPVTLTIGENTIVRQSLDSSITYKDSPSMMETLHKFQEALEKNENLNLDDLIQNCGLPHRLLLPVVPKTKMGFVLFVMVTPYDGPLELPNNFASCGVGFNTKYPDSYPMGYPFDRVVNFWHFHAPNMYFKDVFIFNKNTADVNAS